MVAVGMLLAWLGYSLGLEGWCLFRDYDVTLGQLMSPTHPYAGPWPPALIPSGQIWPGANTASAASAQASSGQAPTPAQVGSEISKVEKEITRILQLPGFGQIK